MNRTLKAATLAIAAASLTLAPAALAPAFAQTQAVVEGLDGDWSGALDVQGQQLPLVLHINTADGATTATLDSPAQGQDGIPISSIARDGDEMTFEIELITGTYEGVVADDDASISGTWRQNGFELPLTFTKQQRAGRPARSTRGT